MCRSREAVLKRASERGARKESSELADGKIWNVPAGIRWIDVVLFIFNHIADIHREPGRKQHGELPDAIQCLDEDALVLDVVRIDLPIRLGLRRAYHRLRLGLGCKPPYPGLCPGHHRQRRSPRFDAALKLL